MPILLLLLALCVQLGLPAPAPAQEAPREMTSGAPVVRAMLFGDAEYLATDRDVPDGFVLGQLVGHLNVGLTDRLSLFTELTATPHPTEYTLEVERAIVRYDFSDLLKLSLGRYHTPIGYWNTAYHHGTWLQTSVGRPEAVKFGSRFIPVHFVGVLAEGTAPSTAVGLGYALGLGNGRGSVISRAGDAGDVNANRAWVANLYARPAALLGLKAGVGYYHDLVSLSEGPAVGEGIASAYLALERESPEVIAEYEHVEHDPRTGASSVGSDGYFVQLAYRLPGPARALKPYARVERLAIGDGDPVFPADEMEYRAALAGLRFDFAPFAALKAEYRLERFAGSERSHSFHLQASFVAPILSGESGPTP
jgi:hypothetical protein